MIRNNISDVVAHGLCVGCGLCHDICNKGCISIKIRGGGIMPSVETNSCIECGLCLKVCPGREVMIEKISKELWGDKKEIKYDNHIGFYLSCFAAYSTDYEIRFHCASGGAITSFLIFLFEKKLIEGAIVIGYDERNAIKPKAYIARNSDEVIKARGSKYCVVSYENMVNEMLSKEGRYVVVGLPCHIHGFRKYASLFKKVKERIVGYFSLYCSATKKITSQDYLLWRYGVDKQKIRYFNYRDEGCLGSMVAKDRDGNKILEVPCLQYYLPLRGFFNNPRCGLCVDHYGELADISFGDLTVDKYAEDKIGISSVVVRNLEWAELLQNAEEEGHLYMEEIDSECLKMSQLYAFKHKKGPGIVAAFCIRKLLGMKVPNYDVKFQSPLKLKFLVREVSNYICRFIGRHRPLWFVIKALDKNK